MPVINWDAGDAPVINKGFKYLSLDRYTAIDASDSGLLGVSNAPAVEGFEIQVT